MEDVLSGMDTPEVSKVWQFVGNSLRSGCVLVGPEGPF